jgi:hypothetical protein
VLELRCGPGRFPPSCKYHEDSLPHFVNYSTYKKVSRLCATCVLTGLFLCYPNPAPLHRPGDFLTLVVARSRTPHWQTARHG